MRRRLAHSRRGRRYDQRGGTDSDGRGSPKVSLAILPAGTGNDFAETLAIPDDPEEAEAVLRQNRVRTFDVVRSFRRELASSSS